MKKIVLTLIFFVLLFSCEKQKEVSEGKSDVKVESNDKIHQNNVVSFGKIYEIGYFDTYEKLPKIKIDSAIEKDFSRLKNQSSFIKNKIKRKNGFFYLPTNKGRLQFRDDEKVHNSDANQDGSSEFLGFNSALNLYAVEDIWVTDNLGFGQLSLIDKEMANCYKIISFGDNSVSVPIVSPSGKFMIYWQDPIYDTEELQLAVLKINSKKHPKDFLREYAYVNIKISLNIEEIRWKDDHHFFVKGFKSGLDQDGNKIKTFKYLSGKID